MSIEYGLVLNPHAGEISALFEATFAASETAEEGKLIAKLARDLIQTTPPDELFVFSANENGKMLGSIVFTRLWFESDLRRVFLLSPVAVSSDQQGIGIGTELINYGLDTLKQKDTDIAVTYGDPEYYQRVGFQPISTALIPPPLPLEQPHGWLAQSLANEEIMPFKGPSRCAQALRDPAYW